MHGSDLKELQIVQTDQGPVSSYTQKGAVLKKRDHQTLASPSSQFTPKNWSNTLEAKPTRTMRGQSNSGVTTAPVNPSISGSNFVKDVDHVLMAPATGQGDKYSASESPHATDLDPDESEDEGQAEYVHGGYHDAHVGTIYKQRYRIECKLGWGHFSTVYLATDHWMCPPEYVAIKFQKSAVSYYDAALDEIEILGDINRAENMPQWRNHQGQRNITIMGDKLKPKEHLSTGIIKFLNSFVHHGPNGIHVAMVFEPLGPNVLRLMKQNNFKGVSTDTCRKIAAQVLNGLDFLHSCCDVIHTDLKPENVLCVTREWPPPSYVDLDQVIRYAPTFNAAGCFSGPSLADDHHEYRMAMDNVKRIKRSLQTERAGNEDSSEVTKMTNTLTCSSQTNNDDDSLLVNKPDHNDEPILMPPVRDDFESPGLGQGHHRNESGVANLSDCGDIDVSTNVLRAREQEQPIVCLLSHRPRMLRPSCPPLPSANRCDQIEFETQKDPLENLMSIFSTSKLYNYNSIPTAEKIVPPDNLVQKMGGDPNYRPSMNLLPTNLYSSVDRSDIPVPLVPTSPILHSTESRWAVSSGTDRAEFQPVVPDGIEYDDLLYETTGYHTIPMDGALQLFPHEGHPNFYHVATEKYQKFEPYVLTVEEYLSSKSARTARNQKEILYSAIGPINIRNYLNDLLLNSTDLDYKIVDLGNACWTNRHFSDGIQTRQYRCPEVVVGAGYDTAADIWSVAAMMFELKTGDFLFEPRSDPRHQWCRDEDHLALISELVGPLPDLITREGQHSESFFDRQRNMIRIPDLKYWGLTDVLCRRYSDHLSEPEAENFSDFLLPMLTPNPAQRCSAYMALRHPWLKMCGNSTAFLAPELRSATADQQLLCHLRLPERATGDSRIILLRQGAGAFPMSALKRIGLPQRWYELINNNAILAMYLPKSPTDPPQLSSVPLRADWVEHTSPASTSQVHRLLAEILEENPHLAEGTMPATVYPENSGAPVIPNDVQ